MDWITIRQLALICCWCFLFAACTLSSLCVSLFIRLLVVCVCPSLLISSTPWLYVLPQHKDYATPTRAHSDMCGLPGQSGHVNEVKVQLL